VLEAGGFIVAVRKQTLDLSETPTLVLNHSDGVNQRKVLYFKRQHFDLFFNNLTQFSEVLLRCISTVALLLSHVLMPLFEEAFFGVES